MWLTDLLPGSSKICPTCPTYKNKVGQLQPIDIIALSDLSDQKQRKTKSLNFFEATEPAESVRLMEQPTTAQFAHARRMLVDCPSTGGKLHCWHCSRCDQTRECMAWRERRQNVEFFRQSGEPHSLYLVEEMEAAEVAR